MADHLRATTSSTLRTAEIYLQNELVVAVLPLDFSDRNFGMDLHPWLGNAGPIPKKSWNQLQDIGK